METLCYFYHPDHSDHLGSTSWVTDSAKNGVQYCEYLPYGEPFIDQRSTTWSSRYTFSGKERDSETGYSYFGARYYHSDLSIWLSVDPMSDKYPNLTPYAYCANNPVILVDPDGRDIEGDYYTVQGEWLGSDGIDDNKAYTATSKNPDGTFNNVQELPISNSELLDRATWVHGECGGSDELITDRVQNKGDASSTSDARVADYYAFAINNAVKTDGSFDKSIKIRMSKEVDGKTQNTSEGYFSGTGVGGNSNSKNFANARQKGMTNLMSLNGAKTSISAVIKSVTSSNDPTGGARAWVGEKYAKAYYQNKNTFTSGARFQFSFSSGNGKYYHSFYKKIVMKGIYLLFFLLLININCLLIRAQEIENATLLTVSQLETTYRIKDYPIVYYLASRDYKTVEYFELKDTLFRDTLLFFYQKYTIDSIFFKETNYSGSFNLFEAYSYKWGKKEFIILSFVNMYQMGTDQQTYYVIFQIKNNRGIIKSKFTRDSYLSKISVVKRCNTIKLKCKSWDKN